MRNPIYFLRSDQLAGLLSDGARVHTLRRRPPRPGFRARTALTLALLVAISSLVTGVAMVTEQSATAAARASMRAGLTVSPRVYVGGQRLTWSGNVGHPGRRALELQFNMGSVVGNHWSTVDGFRAHTRADGSFSFGYPAPSMFNIHYRVKAGRYVTPARLFHAKTQDLTVQVTGRAQNSTNEPGRVDEGQSFGITVNTTPTNIYRSPEAQGLPVLLGRALTLQQRVGESTWRTVARTAVGGDGSGTFSGLEDPAGVSVYRVRQEDYLTEGNQIGWSQSFPLYVLVGQDAQDWYDRSHGVDQAGTPAPDRTGSLGRQPQTASQRYSWFPSVFDFAWEYGQSLSSAPSRGTSLHGSWADYSSGTGRVSKYNGGLAIDSKRYAGAGPGDFGTTAATLHGNAMTYGRWETSMRIRSSFERGGGSYEVLAELVPESANDYDCGSHDITIASISPFSKQVRFGAQSEQHQWSGTTRAAYTPLANAYNVAVEVERGHITWFLNGSPVGSVTSKEAVPGVPMTMRLSLRGHGDAEMNQTGLISDWQRGFPATTGKGTLSKNRLTSANASTSDCGAS